MSNRYDHAINNLSRPTHESLMNTAWRMLFEDIAIEMDREGIHPEEDLQPYWDVASALFPDSYWAISEEDLLELGF